MANDPYIELSGIKYNRMFLKGVSESYALAVLSKGGGHDENQVRNAWKQANGLTVRNYSKPKLEMKKKPKVKDLEDDSLT